MKNLGPSFILRVSALVTDTYVATNHIDLINHNNVAIDFGVTANEAGITADFKPEWGHPNDDGTITWGVEPLFATAAAASGEVVQTPYGRVIRMTLDSGNADYIANVSERYQRLKRFLRFKVKSSASTATGKVEIKAQLLNN